MNIFERTFGLHGKVALVTGASGGIGRVLASALAEAGAAVALHGQSSEKLEEARHEIKELGANAAAFTADLSDVEACKNLVAQVRERSGRVDILVNCAGLNRRCPLVEATVEDFQTIVDVNLRAALILAQECHRSMLENGGGKIINIGSVSSTYGLGGVGVYGASKAAVAHLTKTLAVEWARDNIQVNCLAPGFIKTPLTEGALWGDEKRKRWLLSRIPARRAGEPQDLIGALLLMASSASDYMTGQLITVDGGFISGGWWEADE
jgi:NAD(P)-dependent dehydrogenase (short-subunit alcohol dehydrogenase family)